MKFFKDFLFGCCMPFLFAGLILSALAFGFLPILIGDFIYGNKMGIGWGIAQLIWVLMLCGLHHASEEKGFN
jgi:hypothetical protein